jgi:vacuolar protein sorting-associated protein 11
LAPSSPGLLLADIHGSIHLPNTDFVLTKAGLAHWRRGTGNAHGGEGVLVTLGEEDGVRAPLLKVWDLEKGEKKSGMGIETPVLLRSVKVQT